jgi:hypothetical protein
MWESPAGTTSTSHHQARAEAIAAGEIEPLYIGDMNMEEVGISTGVAGHMEEPPRGWRRLRWSEVATRLGAVLDPTEGVLERQLRGFTVEGSWPISVLPPPEGTLDPLSLRSIADALGYAHHGGTVAYHTVDEWYGDGGFSRGDVQDVVRLSFERGHSPNNWWADDRSWLLWTDYDLQTSALFGPPDLIELLKAIPELETLPYDNVWWPEGSTLNRS